MSNVATAREEHLIRNTTIQDRIVMKVRGKKDILSTRQGLAMSTTTTVTNYRVTVSDVTTTDKVFRENNVYISTQQ